MNRLHRLRSENGMSLLEIIVSMMVFSIGLLSIGAIIPYSMQRLSRARNRTSSVTLAQKLIDEVTVLAFDELEANGTLETIKAPVPGDLTSPAALGPDGTETYGTFNDMDDFDGLVLDPVPGADGYKCAFDVVYCAASGDTTATGATFYKRVFVRITPPGTGESIALSTVMSYK